MDYNYSEILPTKILATRADFSFEPEYRLKLYFECIEILSKKSEFEYGNLCESIADIYINELKNLDLGEKWLLELKNALLLNSNDDLDYMYKNLCSDYFRIKNSSLE